MAQPVGVAGGPAQKPSKAVSLGVKAVTAPVSHAAHSVATKSVPRPTPSAAAGAVAAPFKAPKLTPGFARNLPKPTRYTGGADPIAAIQSHPGVSLAKLLKPASGVLGHLGSDFVNLPKISLEGLEGLGGSLASDLAHGRLGMFANRNIVGQSHTATMLKQGIISDPVIQSILQGSLKPIEMHPGYALMDLAGVEGAVGRGAGAVGRSGALGEDVAKAASTAREGRILAPGLAPDVRHYSPDVIRKAFQVAFEHEPSSRLVSKLLKKRVDEFVPTAKGAKQAALKDAEDHLKAAMPEGPAAHVVSHAAMGTAGSPAEFEAQLRDRILPQLQDAHARGGMSPAVRKANEQAQANVEAFLAHPNTPAAFESAGHYEALRQPIETELARLGLHTSAEMERRALMPIAQTQMPDTVMVPRTSKAKLSDGRTVTRNSGIPTLRAHQARAALGDIGQLQKELKAAEGHKIAMKNFQGEQERAVRQGEQALARAEKQEAKQAAFIQGRYGIDEPLKTKAAQVSSGALGKRLVNTDNVTSKLQDLKAALGEARVARRTEANDRVKVAKENLKELRKEFAEVHKPYLHEKQHGLMVEDPKAPMIRQGNYRGRQLRPLANDEIRAYMEAHGIPHADYIKMTAPTEDAGFFGTRISRGGTKGKSFTGQGIESGAFTPGYAALSRTHLNSVAQIQDALTHDRFINESAIHVPPGEDWRTYAEQYEHDHGIQLEAVYRHPQAVTAEQRATIDKLQGLDDKSQATVKATLDARDIPEGAAVANDRVALVPKVMMDRYREHLNVAPPHGVVAGLNRAFRNTVLPFSTKWLMGNTAEAGLRAGLVGASPRSFALASRVIQRMRELGYDDQADHLERMATGGLHYGMQERLNAEHVAQTGSVPAQHAVVTTAKTLSRGYTGFVQGIFKFNRHIESSAEKSVLGVHMQHQMQEFANTWAKTVAHQKDYVDRLAEGYADPRMAADAGRYVHDTLGQYDRFSPAMKKFVGTWAPFFPWYKNALKFVYYTLPAGHPVAQATLLAAARGNQTAFDKGRDVPHGMFGPIPIGDLLSAPKVGPQDYLNLGRYTPMGAFTQGPVDYAVNGVAPQLQGIWHALSGQDPFGNDLTGPDGKLTNTGGRALVALNQLLTEFTGPLNTIHRVIAEHGSTPYNTSTLWNTQLKPNTHHNSGVVKVFDPFVPTHLGKAHKGGKPTLDNMDKVHGNLDGTGFFK